MSFINTLYWDTVVYKISEANSCVYVCLPSIDEELSTLLIDLKKEKNIVVNVCVDNSEEVIRNGYGEATGIEYLLETEITIKESKGNRISFIIIDNQGYIIFPESRIFSAEPSGSNAIEIDAFTASRLIAYFFPPKGVFEKEKLQERFDESFEKQKDWIEQVSNEIIEQRIEAVTTEFKRDNFNETKKSLIKIPPIEPDLQRRIKTYTTKVQFVELKFSGINLQARTINIPKDAIPINNEHLKKLLLTKIKLFQNMNDNKGFEVFRQLRKKVDLLREDYLKPVTCREGKSLIQVEKKVGFKGRLQKIKQEIRNINKALPDLIEKATLETKDLIKAELLSFFRINLPDSVKQYNDKDIRERKLYDFVDTIVRKIPFPKTEKLIENISLNDYYYDLTFQDFSDDRFIKELQKKEILKGEDIKSIVEMKNAFAEKR